VTLPPPGAGSLTTAEGATRSRMPAQAPAAVRLAASDLSDNRDVIPEPLGHAPDQLDIAKSVGRSLCSLLHQGGVTKDCARTGFHGERSVAIALSKSMTEVKGLTGAPPPG
jgi:hypothetical protein